MYVNIGSDKMLFVSDIVGVFDLDNATTGRRSREFLKKAEKDGLSENAATDIPHSFVVTKDKIYIAQASSRVIARRTVLAQRRK